MAPPVMFTEEFPMKNSSGAWRRSYPDNDDKRAGSGVKLFFFCGINFLIEKKKVLRRSNHQSSSSTRLSSALLAASSK